MLGVEFFPAIIYFILMFFVPNSPRWLFNNHKPDLAKEVLISIHGEEKAEIETKSIIKNIESNNVNVKTKFSDLFSPALRYIMGVGLFLGYYNKSQGLMQYIFMQHQFLNKLELELMLHFRRVFY